MGVKHSVLSTSSVSPAPSVAPVLYVIPVFKDYFTIDEQKVKYGELIDRKIIYLDGDNKLEINYSLKISNFESFVSSEHKLKGFMDDIDFLTIKKLINELIKKEENHWTFRNRSRFRNKLFAVIEQIIKQLSIYQKYLIIVFDNYNVILEINNNSVEEYLVIEIGMKPDERDLQMFSWE